MRTMEDIFGTKKPVIGMVHLLPLLGSHCYDGDDDRILECALSDALALERAGVFGIMVENFGDAPFEKDRVSPHTVAQMTQIIRALQEEITIPLGVNVLRNDALSAIAIARVTGCEFIRVNVLCGVVATDQGIIEGCAAPLLAYRRRLGSSAQILADVHVKHGTSLYRADIVTAARELVERGGGDAVIVTGGSTGGEIDLRELRTLREAVDFPVLAGSGVTKENLVSYHPHCDGMIVGSHFKQDGDPRAQVESFRVEAFMKEMGRLRDSEGNEGDV